MTLPRFKSTAGAGTLTTQGGKVVERDEKGRVVNAVVVPSVPSLKNWRKFARELTDNGASLLVRLNDIAHGKPFRAVRDDGTESEWEVPALETQRAAAKDLFEFIHGKAVAQTEVLAAEKATEDVEQYKALSDEALAAAARPFLERVNKRGENE